MQPHPTPFTAPYRSMWLMPLVVTMGLAVVTTGVFWLTNLDLAVSKFFYNPDPVSGIWVQTFSPWQHVVYNLPFLTIGLVMVFGLWHLYRGISQNSRLERLRGIFLILAVGIGPGLLVNLILKGHWGRPRPHQVSEFGGQAEFLTLLVTGDRGKSFPAGHPAAGFVLMALALVWARRKPLMGYVIGAVAILTGSLLSLGRISSGNHFLSDCMWSGYLIVATTYILFHWGMRIPIYEDQPEIAKPRLRLRTRVALYSTMAVVGVVAIFGLLSATHHHHRRLTPIHRYQFTNFPTDVMFTFPTGNVQILPLEPTANVTFLMEVTAKGFGFPWSKVRHHHDIIGANPGTLIYELHPTPTFTELNTEIKIHIDPAAFDSLHFTMEGGRILYPSDIDLAVTFDPADTLQVIPTGTPQAPSKDTQSLTALTP